MEGNSIKLLMLCYYYPPLRTSGVFRSLEFSKNMCELGCVPQVLTVSDSRDHWVKKDAEIPEGIQIERAPEYNLNAVVEFLNGVNSRLVRCFGRELKHNFFRENLCIPDPQIAWCSTKRGIELAKHADCIYVSCSPFSSAKSGVLIKRATGKPLVLDFRDAWSLNPHVSHSALHTWMIKRLERQVLAETDILIVNTEGAGKLYRETYPEFADKIRVIPNGYDLLHLAENSASGKYTIMHVGSFYGQRQPNLLLEALAEIADPNIEFVQVGGKFDAYDSFKDLVNIQLKGSVQREEAIGLMRTSCLLYLKQGLELGVKDYVAVGAKTYEYLATGLPILAECPPGDNADLVSNYGVYKYMVTTDDKAQLKQSILKAKQDWPQITPKISDAFINKFNRKNLTNELLSIIREVTS